jgi:hypothetical protein
MNILVVSFDTAVVAVTLFQILRLVHLEKGLRIIHKASLTSLLTQQGDSCLYILVMYECDQEIKPGMIQYVYVHDHLLLVHSDLNFVLSRFVFTFVL